MDIIQGSYNAKRFKRFISGLLDQMSEFPGPRSVIVMDNCGIHKSKEVTDMIYEQYYYSPCYSAITTHPKMFRGMRCEFLPPYSPDYNPLELAFSAIKAEFRHCLPELEKATTADNELEVILAIHDSVFSITFWDVCGWFRKCGYG